MLFNIVKDMLFVGIGIQEKVKEFTKEMVKKGESSNSQAAIFVKELNERVEKNKKEVSNTITNFIVKTVQKMNIPTKDDIEELNKKIEALSKKVKQYEEIIKKKTEK